MRKLFLTSVTQNVMDQLIEFINKKPQETKVAFITTAADPYENKWFVEEDLKKWKESKFQIVEFDIKNKDFSSLNEELQSFDVIYVAGGNTFFLLQETIKSGFDKIILELLEKGKIYCGGSAGALLVCPTIEPIKEFDDPKKAPELESFDALNLVNFVILPHLSEKNKESYNNIIAKYPNYEFKTLNDNQAIIVKDNEVELIGPSN